MKCLSIAGGMLLAFGVAGAAPALADRVTTRPFGTMPDGTAIKAITLDNGHGMRVTIMTLGAAVQSVIAPDRTGRPGDVVLGYDSLQGYLTNPNYFGATVGRVANRIAKGQFTLDGATMPVRANLGAFTQPISFIGLPVAAVPVWDGASLPLGVQVIAAPWREDLALRVARELERSGVARAPVAA